MGTAGGQRARPAEARGGAGASAAEPGAEAPCVCAGGTVGALGGGSACFLTWVQLRERSP